VTWSQNATTGVLTKSGTARATMLLEVDTPAAFEARFECTNKAHEVRALVRGSKDTRTGWLVGVLGTLLEIRRVEMGEIAASESVGAGHGLAAAETYTLVVRVSGDTITAEVRSTDNIVIECELVTEDFRGYTGIGVYSEVDGATVTSFTLFEIAPVFSDLSEVFWCLAGGNLYATVSGDGLGLIAAGVAPISGKLSADSFDGILYWVGGGISNKWEPVPNTVAAWSADGHPTYTLPGATEEGTTTLTLLKQFRGRLAGSGVEDTPFAIYAPAIAEPNTWNTGELAEGRAVVLGVGRNVTVGEPIVGFEVLSNNALLVACTNSMYVALGDLGDLAAEIPRITGNTGCSGPNALATTADGIVAVHSPEGLFVVAGQGEPIPISKAILSEYIQFPRTERGNYTVTLLRDPARCGMHIWLTKTTGSSLHFWYDELTGGYEAGRGGFFPETYAGDIEPTCGVVWKGRPVIGTRSGRIVEFDDTVASDLGEAFTSYCPFSWMGPGVIDGDIIMHRGDVLLGNDSDTVKVRLYGGGNAEQVFQTTARRLLATSGVAPFDTKLAYELRAPALVAELRNTVVDRKWWAEGVDIYYEIGARTSWRGFKPPMPVSPNCRPSGISGVSPPPPPAPDGPGAGTRPENPGSPPPPPPPPPPPTVLGCTDPAATNYNPLANSDDGSCTYAPPPPPPPPPPVPPGSPESGGGVGVYVP